MRWLLPIVTCQALAWGFGAEAQEPGAPAPSQPSSSASAPAAKAPPEVLREAPPIYVKDENGKLQLLLGWKFEEILERMEQAEAQTQPDQPPPYVLESFSATGSASGESADLTIDFAIWAGETAVRVPLRLNQAVLRPDGFHYEGSGQPVLQFDDAGGGYVVWLRGEANQRHRLTLRVAVPLSTLGEETRLRLFVPRATTSQLKLTVPVAGAVADVSGGATLSDPAPGEGQSTVLAVQGLCGQESENAPFNDFQLTWRKAQGSSPRTRPVLEAAGVVLAKMDRHSVVTCEATLTVRGDGGRFDRFRVTLPKGAELLPSTGSAYSATAVTGQGAAPGETIVEIRRDSRSPEPMQARLTTRQTRQTAAGGWFELGGFEVIGAVRQSGYVGVDSAGDWQVRCVAGWGVRQIDQLPESSPSKDALAGSDLLFEYFGQPFSLTARVVEPRTHVHVEPAYQLYVHDDRVELEARLKYTIRGAKAFAVGLELPGWQLDEVGPDAVVAVEDVSDRSGEISIPLAQPSTGEVEITLRAHQAVAPQSESLSLSLPRPKADSISPAVVAVVPADNVELIPEPEAIVGLVRQQAAGQLAAQAAPAEIRKGQQEPLCYRGAAPEAVFGAGFKVHEQKIAVDATTEVTLNDRRANVRETLGYTIAYEPIEALTLEVPAALASQGPPEVVLDGQPLKPVPVSEAGGTAAPSRPIRMQVALPAATIGECDLEVRYSREVDELLPTTSVICEIPLVTAVEGNLSSNTLYVTAPRGVEVRDRGPAWQPSQGPATRPPRRHGLALSAAEWVSEVVLGLQHEQVVATVVERAWIQTYLTHDARHERAVFRFTSDQNELELSLPAGVDFRQMEVWLGTEDVADRKPVAMHTTPEGHLVIPLVGDSDQASGEPAPRRFWLEIEYEFADGRPGPGRMSMVLPGFGGDVWVQRMYWDLVLPRNEHVVVAPGGFTPEYEWGWTGSFWGREPSRDQAQLESWSGATPAQELPQATSRYLFSSQGPVIRIELRTAGRWLIVLVASSLILAVGLALIYLPPCRHPAALLAAAAVLVGAAVLYPGPALLGGEAASLGLALALLAAILYRATAPRHGGVIRREPSSSIVDRGSTQVQDRPPAPSKPGSKGVTAVQVPMRTSDVAR